MTSPRPPRPLSWREKIAYAAGDTASCFYWQTFSTFLLIFYTDTFGLKPAAVATLLLLPRFWDAALDPIMGVIADRTRSKHGKFRPWILWGILPFSFFGVLMFVTPNFSYHGKLVYAYIIYTLVMMAYTMVNVPYGALLGVISPDSHERTKLASYRFVGAYLGNIAVQAGLLYFVKVFGGGNDRVGYPLAFGVFAALAGVLFLGTFAFTRERVAPPNEPTHIKSDLADLLRNSPWVMLCLIGLGTLIYISVRNAATLYYFKYIVGDEAAATGFLIWGSVASFFGALSTPWITRLLGSKKAALAAITLICALVTEAFYFIPPSNRTLLYISNIALALPNSALFPLIWSMYADTADYGEWKYNRRATGLVFSAATLSQKIGWAVGGSVAGYVLENIGFVANATQTAGTRQAILHMMSTIPAAVGLGVLILSLFYKLNADTERMLARELAGREARTIS
ncbi:MAG TPA: MFS transporter [Opitutaceae bacterium]|nr:MFS transporter [Opitutaceae bacterium]